MELINWIFLPVTVKKKKVVIFKKCKDYWIFGHILVIF